MIVNLSFNCADFATAIRTMAKFTGYTGGKKKATEGYVLISFRKSGFIDMTLDTQQGGLTAGYEFISFRATGFEDKNMYAIPVQMMLEASKRIRKNTRGQVSIEIAEDGSVKIQVAENVKADPITGTCGNTDQLMLILRHQQVKDMLAKNSGKVEIAQGGLLASTMEIGLAGTETERKVKPNHSYDSQVLLDIGTDHSYVVGTNAKKLAVAELAVEGKSIVYAENPVQLLFPAKVAGNMVGLFKQEATSKVEVSYTKQRVLVEAEATAQGTGRYFILMDRVPVESYPKWRTVVPVDLYKDRTVAELAGGSLLMSLSSIANVALHNTNNKCTVAVQKNQVSVFTQREEDLQRTTAQAVPAVVTGEPTEVAVNFTYVKDSVLPLTNRFGKVCISAGGAEDNIVVFSEHGKMIIAPIKTSSLQQAGTKETVAGVKIEMIRPRQR